MSDILKPENAAQLHEAVRWAVGEEASLEVLGQGSKRGFGRPLQTQQQIDLSGLSGITLYEPEELVLSARAGTPIAEIRSVLEENNQEMAFEPPDWAPLWGGAEGAGSLGGVLSANLAGPRRLKAGAARDHFLGFEAISGRGELYKSGGRVMKNVTGYDLSKLMAGSFGTLGVMSDVTIKVLPKGEKTWTVLFFGLGDEAAQSLMSRALGSPHEVSSAAHLPARQAARSGVDLVSGAGGSVTALRLEGPGPSVEYRCKALRQDFQDEAESEELHSQRSRAFWAEVANLSLLSDDAESAIWRISTQPTAGPSVRAALEGLARLEHFYDWGGGLLWLSLPAGGDADADGIREAVGRFGGHATLLRAPDPVRSGVSVFHPQDLARQALTKRIKDSFDPRGVLNPGKMYKYP